MALNTPPVIFLGLFGACGLVIASLGFLKFWTSPKLYPAELVLPDYPLLLGETYLIRYRRRLRNSTLRGPAHTETQLTCEELPGLYFRKDESAYPFNVTCR